MKFKSITNVEDLKAGKIRKVGEVFEADESRSKELLTKLLTDLEEVES